MQVLPVGKLMNALIFMASVLHDTHDQMHPHYYYYGKNFNNNTVTIIIHNALTATFPEQTEAASRSLSLGAGLMCLIAILLHF